MIGFVLALVPLRFTRAIRRGLRDPEFRPLFAIVVLILVAGTIFYWEV